MNWVGKAEDILMERAAIRLFTFVNGKEGPVGKISPNLATDNTDMLFIMLKNGYTSQMIEYT